MEESIDDEKDVVTIAKKLADVVKAKKKLTLNETKILGDLVSQLLSVSHCKESQFTEIQKKILRWEREPSSIWDANEAEAADFLNAVDETRKLIEELESLGFSKTHDDEDMLRLAYTVLESAMKRLEMECKHILEQNKHSYGSGKPINSYGDDSDLRSVRSPGGESFESSALGDSSCWSSEELPINMMNQSTISNLKKIVDLMFLSSYGSECSIAYIANRSYVLDDCLLLLGIEKVSVESVMKLDFKTLHSMMKKWTAGIKTFVKCLTGEKFLGKNIFSGHEEAYQICFYESSKPSMLQLLSFGEAISIGPHKPEKLDFMLRMYESLAGLLPEFDSLFDNEISSTLLTQCHDLLKTLGEAIVSAFKDFDKAVAHCDSSHPLRTQGGIHPVTSYVMNYLILLVEYKKTLDFLLQSNTRDDESSPMAGQFRVIASTLLSNLKEQANAYKDVALQNIFLMNNVYHVVKKIKNTELLPVFGVEWVKPQISVFKQYATDYERTTWSPVLAILKDESRSSKSSKGIVIKKFQKFYAAFEEVHRNQTTWVIPDESLRDDVRISASIKVIQAYRTFMNQYKNQISDRHVKYSDEDLEKLLSDFFEGPARTMQSPHGEHKASMPNRASFFKREFFHASSHS